MNSEILKKILRLQFSLRTKSKQAFLGSYRSAFRGTGIDFSDFREYIPGDDVRSVSWPLTAKMGKPYVKLFEEERGLTFVLMIDVSASSSFGSVGVTKLEVIQQISALLALSAEKNKDQTGLLLFSNQVEHYVPPKKGRNHVFRIMKDIHSFQAQSKKTQFKEPCAYLSQILKKRSYIFILSDFLSEDFEKPLQFLNCRHDTVGIIIQDPLEKKLPSAGLIELEDIETGKIITVDTSSYQFQKEYQEKTQEIGNKRDKMLKKINLPSIYIQTDEDIFKPLFQFFNKKAM